MRVKIKKGAATLSVILLISGIVMELSVVGIIIATLVSNTSFSAKLSSEALAAARAGAQDGIVKIVRYKNCNATSCGGTVPYTITLDRATAQVEIIDNLNNTLTVRSTGTVLNRKKMVEAVVGVDPITGKTNVVSIAEKPI